MSSCEVYEVQKLYKAQAWSSFILARIAKACIASCVRESRFNMAVDFWASLDTDTCMQSVEPRVACNLSLQMGTGKHKVCLFSCLKSRRVDKYGVLDQPLLCLAMVAFEICEMLTIGSLSAFCYANERMYMQQLHSVRAVLHVRAYDMGPITKWGNQCGAQSRGYPLLVQMGVCGTPNRPFHFGANSQCTSAGGHATPNSVRLVFASGQQPFTQVLASMAHGFHT